MGYIFDLRNRLLKFCGKERKGQKFNFVGASSSLNESCWDWSMLQFRFFSFWRNLKNKGSFGWKTVNLAIFSEMDRKIRFSGQNYIYFWDFVKKKKNRNSNMLQSQQLSLSEEEALTKLNFWPRRSLPQNFKSRFRRSKIYPTYFFLCRCFYNVYNKNLQWAN